MTPSDIKLARLTSDVKTSDDYWYITKQTCNFRDLCYIADILMRWDEDGPVNYETFFNEIRETEPYNRFIGKTAHRATINLVPFGLCRGSSSYSPTGLTDVFYRIRQITDGNYAETDLYQDIIDAQTEKIHITTSHIDIHPMMFTFKVLLTLGDVTGQYRISIDEFKTFVATASRWNEYFETVASILRYRTDDEYRAAVAGTQGKAVADGSRYNLVISNHSLIAADNKYISIAEGKIDEVRVKVTQFELVNPQDIMIDQTDAAEHAAEMAGHPEQTETLQQIFFGAPGVGKSHHLKSIYGNEDDVIRTTFHPETDYAAFVGCYKPQTVEGEIVYRFQPQAFTEAYVKAWTRYVQNEGTRDTYLIIEEINRGNCAQIFGDIFQIIDRDEHGLSDYSIRADKDLSEYLSSELSQIREQLNGIKPGLGSGEVLMLPPNLHILATMNTSDQSLFPIDSAFRRRWDWVYMPVETAPKDGEEQPISRLIRTKEHTYDWGEFIAAVNGKIFNTTLSEDKQLGFWFVKPKRGSSVISAGEFVSKVIFYLWNDIYKDFGDDATSIFYFAADGAPDSRDKIRHTFRDFTPGFQQVDHGMIDAFIRNLGVDPQPAE